MLRGITCPVLVIEGTEDRCQPRGRFDTVARLTGAERLVARRRRATCRWAATRWWSTGRSRASSTGSPARRRRRASWTAGRWPAAAGALPVARRSGSATSGATSPSPTRCARQRPDVRGRVAHPVSRSPSSSSSAGETRAPGVGATWPASPRHFESESGEHDLHAFQAMRRMDEVLVTNFMVFDDLVARGALRPVGRRRGLGPRPLPAREPRAEAGAVRLDDRLRGLGADARRRRARGVPDRGLQRRDGRARRALPARCATGRCSSATRTTWSTVPAGPGPADRSASGPRSTSTSPAT